VECVRVGGSMTVPAGPAAATSAVLGPPGGFGGDRG